MGAQPVAASYDFRDHGRTVQIQLTVHSDPSDLSVRSTGDSLTIIDNSASRTVLKVVQLYSTVDARHTDWNIANGTLTVTLTKLEPAIQWTALDTQPDVLPQQAVSEAQTSRVLQERDRVKALLTAAQSDSVSEIQAAADYFRGQHLGDIKDGTGKNALHFAAQLGQTDVCHYLLTEQQVDPNSQDEAGINNTPWHQANSGCLAVLHVLAAPDCMPSTACSTTYKCHYLHVPLPLHPIHLCRQLVHSPMMTHKHASLSRCVSDTALLKGGHHVSWLAAVFLLVFFARSYISASRSPVSMSDLSLLEQV